MQASTDATMNHTLTNVHTHGTSINPILKSSESSTGNRSLLETNCAKENFQKINSSNNAFQETSVGSADGTTEIISSDVDKLYDREYEQELLLEALDRRLSYVAAKNELILVSGKSGTGKTSLTRNTLLEAVHESGGYFVMGKFDRLRMPQPYSAFVHAFADYVDLLVKRAHGTDVVQTMKKTVMAAVDPETVLLFEMIPALGLLLDVKEGGVTTPSIKSVESQSRLQGVFSNFVRAICSPEVPLVLCIDDLQWADAASLDLFQSLASMEDCQGLILVATCRGNEVSGTDKVAKMLCSLEDRGKTHITHIELFDLSKFAVYEMVKHVLGLNTKQSKALTRTIYKHTSGNGFFVVEFLKTLKERGILYQDDEEQWHWDETLVPMIETCDNAIDFLVWKLKLQSEDVRIVMATASCLGGEFDENLLRTLIDNIDISKALTVGVKQGILVQNKTNSCRFKFTHDQIQQAAYSLIPAIERDDFHLGIGRKLLEVFSLGKTKAMQNNIFLVADQLLRGVNLIEDQEEKNKVAEVCLKAGQQASKASDVLLASTYLDLGISLMNRRSWRDQYFLMLALYNTASEVAYCRGNWEKLEKITGEVIVNSPSLNDKIVAYSTRIYSYGPQHKLPDAIKTGCDVLQSLNEPIPTKISKFYILKEYVKTRYLLNGLTDEAIMKLPPMVDQSKINAMSILNVVSLIAHLHESPHFAISIFKMVQLTLKYGLCNVSSWAFASLGILFCASDSIHHACRYGELALKLVKKFDRKEWFPRVNFVVNGVILHFKKSTQACLQPLKGCIRGGIESGDIEIAMSSAYVYSSFVWNRSPIRETKVEFVHFVDLMRSYKQGVWMNYTLSLLQTMDNFAGKAKDPLTLTGDHMDQGVMIELCKNNHNEGLSSTVHYYRLVLAYYFNEYDTALEMVAKCPHGAKRGMFRMFLIFFYEGMTALAIARRTKKNRKYIAIAKKHLKYIRRFAKRNPANSMDKLLLLEAEFAVLRGNLEKASSKYYSAILTAESEGLLLEHAGACEKAGLAMLYFRKHDLAAQHFAKAVTCYEKWGAHAKVEQLRRTQACLM